jgi:hypothetical protein
VGTTRNSCQGMLEPLGSAKGHSHKTYVTKFHFSCLKLYVLTRIFVMGLLPPASSVYAPRGLLPAQERTATYKEGSGYNQHTTSAPSLCPHSAQQDLLLHPQHETSEGPSIHYLAVTNMQCNSLRRQNGVPLTDLLTPLHLPL